MSKQLINEYYRKVEKLKRRGGTTNEQSIRKAFEDLLDGYCTKKNLSVIAELRYGNIIPDGTVRDDFQQDYGFWESKDTKDDLEVEIEKKLAKGYPDTNIIFENSEFAVLYQNGKRKLEADFKDEKALNKLLTTFIGFEIPEVTEFRKAVETFKENIPRLADELRELMDKMEKSKNKPYKTAKRQLIQICKLAINPRIGNKEVREMLVQHILTEDMFNFIFNEAQFHRENNIAKAVDNVLRAFYTDKIKRNVTASLGDFYNALKVRVVNISNLDEKQKVLKVAYEEFYKAYNPKGADRLGIVYTPNEIVQFMIESADHLCVEHFDKSLSDKGVQILDPATGTGTFITSLLQHIPSHKLLHKYQYEIHCNEVAILPYYIANLNIEYTFQHLQEDYEPFEKIVLVDTLDNMNFKTHGQQGTFDFFSEENTKRIREQNDLDMTVIIGNPPYNAKQENYNQNNANRPYKRIDQRIKDTYVKYGTAQNQIVVYDMYVRFYRWATDRLNQDGIITFITNNSFLDGRAFDGFRAVIEKEFDYAYIIDLGGNIRELSGKDGIFLGEQHTVFGLGAMVGISIMFLVKTKDDKRKKCQINYIHPCDIRATRKEKFEWIKTTPFRKIPFDRIIPSKKHNWINLADNDFEELIPLIDKSVKSGKSQQAVFKLFSRGVETTRDEWVYDVSEKNLTDKMKFFTKTYNQSVKKGKIDLSIKWSSSLKRAFKTRKSLNFDENLILKSLYRPFYKINYYGERITSHRLTQNHFDIFSNDLKGYNIQICIPGLSSPKGFHVISTNCNFDFNALPAGSQSIPLYRYDENGNRYDNLTDWGRQQFTAHYADDSITKEAIFHYTYAVLHYPAYRKKYELNLKREFPRLPFYTDFWKWSAWGKALMDLHLEYETVERYSEIEVIQASDASDDTSKRKVKPKLKADKANGIIQIDANTQLTGIPDIAWTYKLGNRSALEWILDQYKEKKPRDKTIAEKFNTYQFADYKEQVINLLMRVCTVSVRTMEIVNNMKS